MARDFKAGDVLIFQLEAGYGLLKVLAIDVQDGETIWHVAAYEDLFLDAESADLALETIENMRVGTKHLALTNRAFEATQTARMRNVPMTDAEIFEVNVWKSNAVNQPSDISVRLLLGLR